MGDSKQNARLDHSYDEHKTSTSIPKRKRNKSTYSYRFFAFLKKLSKNKAAVVGGFIILIFVIVSLFPSAFATHDPVHDRDILTKLEGPSSEHWLGTDHLGRDIYSRIIYGTQITLYVAFLSVIIGAFFGVTLGLIAGYYGRWVDSVIMRTMDVLLAFPGILLALAIVSALGPALINVVIAVGIFAIPTFARIVRGSTLSVRKLEYIDAIRALGARDSKIIFQHILPNIMSPVIVQATLYTATAVLIASGLSFLGMGAQPPTPEWGAMLSQGRDYLWNAPHISLYPGIAIVIVVLGFNLFGDGLRDALDPRLKN